MAEQEADGARPSAAMMACELFKLLRGHALSRQQISADLGWTPETVRRWVGELVANGMLLEVAGSEREGTRGAVPRRFSLSPEWGGVAR